MKEPFSWWRGRLAILGRRKLVYTDGAYDHLKGVGGCAFVVVDGNGAVEFEWARGIYGGDSQVAEILAIYYGWNWCRERGYKFRIWTDNSQAVKVLGKTRERYFRGKGGKGSPLFVFTWETMREVEINRVSGRDSWIKRAHKRARDAMRRGSYMLDYSEMRHQMECNRDLASNWKLREMMKPNYSYRNEALTE